MSSARRAGALGNGSAVDFRDDHILQHFLSVFAACAFRLRRLVHRIAVLLLLAVAIVGPWGMVIALILWLVPRLVHAGR